MASMTDSVSSNARQINILIADDHAMFRDTLELYIARAHPDYKCYMAADLHEVVDVLNRGAVMPDLCIIDFLMPGMMGMDSIEALMKSYPAMDFAVMSGIAGKKDIDEILNSSVKGFLPKTLSGRHFLMAIDTMLGGQRFIPYEPDKTVTPSFFGEYNKFKPDIKLTAREQEVLRLLCEGRSNRDIAEQLSLKIVTIKLHIRGIFQKLDCNNRTQATVKAREWGILG